MSKEMDRDALLYNKYSGKRVRCRDGIAAFEGEVIGVWANYKSARMPHGDLIGVLPDANRLNPTWVLAEHVAIL